MKFSQKIVCMMLLVLAAFFSIGGYVLVNGSFRDRMNNAAQQEQRIHAMLCGVVEDRYLDASGRGEETGAAFWAGARLQEQACSFRLTRSGELLCTGGDAMPQADALAALGDGQSLVTRLDGRVLRCYRSELLGGMTLDSAFDVTQIFTEREQSLNRFLVLEAAVLLAAAVVVWFLSCRLTRPLADLTAASERIAAGDYALRTNVRTGDEIGVLSDGFDRMAAAVQDKVAALELSVQQRDDFVGAFTHELKTPMTGIIGYADLLRTMQPDPLEQREAAGAIFHEARRLESLSGKLLQLMGLDESAVALAPVELDRVLAGAIGAAQPVLGGRRVDCPLCGAVVLGDADLLTDLFLNLLTNAAKASGPDQGIAIRTAPADGNRLAVTVKDHGRGIPADQLDRVTEPFYMVDKSRARRQGGSGLGLALCGKIAAAHGGTLTLASTEGEGTAVTITLALTPQKEEQP